MFNEELSEVDKMRYENFARGASGIDHDLADEVERPGRLMQIQPRVDNLMELYHAYPENVQLAIRRQLIPRTYFAHLCDTGYETCPMCNGQGMISPDREEFAPVLGADGKPRMKEEAFIVREEDGSIALDDDGNPITHTRMVEDVRPVAISKEPCPNCDGTGEVKK